jgi:DNA-binding response OmpR family regulator
MVEPGVPPPLTSDPLEDWVRLPVDRTDLNARIRSLSLRADEHSTSAPGVDEWGVLRFGGRQVTLPPLEARLARTLVESYRSVIGRHELTRAGWPGDAPGRNALDVHILRLRRRIEPVGLAVRTVRSRGYLIEAEALTVTPAAAGK